MGYGDGLYGDGLYGGSVGVEYLTNVLGPDSRLAVEIAWGADLSADPDTWSWSDVTPDVRTEQGIETSMGRADEASTSQPASCSFTLDNSSGDYSIGGESRLYPNVRRNTPVRVRVDPDGTGFDVVFQGFADGFTPSWNLPGTVREVQVSASGVLRRLIQGSSPLVSSLRRGLTDQPDTIAYWPCEEGKSASVITPVAGSQEMTFTGSPKFETSTVFDSSAPLPELNGAVFTGIVDPYTDTGRSQVRMLFAFPSEDAAPDGTALFQVFTTGSAARWDGLYKTNGNFQLIAYDRFNSVLYTSSTFGFGVNGSGRFYSFEMIQDGLDIDWTVGTLTPYIPLGYTSGTVTGQTVGTVSRIVVNPSGLLTDVGFGHAIVQNDVTNRYETQKQLDANRGDYASQRAARLCDENNVLFSVLGDGGSGTTSIADGMGPQSIDTLVNLLRECEAVDQGVLFDGVTDGLLLHNRYYNENRAASLIVSAEDAKLASGFGPVDDDQRNRNRVEAKRSNGSSAVFEDRDGPLGTESIGIYDSSVTLNALRDDAMPLYAGWLVALGTIEGYRYPTLTVDLLATPELAPDWLSVRPGSRIDVTGLDAVLPGHPVGTLSLLVEGVSNSFTGDTWTGTAKCSLYEPWRIGTVAEDPPFSSTGEYVFRVLSDGSEIVSDVAAGAISISVSTPSGPLWTTDPDDFPFVIEIGGVTATVTGISGTSSPQTFTITDLAYDKSAGSEVTLHRPTRLGL